MGTVSDDIRRLLEGNVYCYYLMLTFNIIINCAVIDILVYIIIVLV